MSHPAFTLDEQLTRATFLALMWSLSYPGRIYELPENSDPFHAIADTLLDLETTFYTPDSDLALYLGRNSARDVSAERADYHFYPQLMSDMLDIVERATNGTLLYPDQGASLFIGCNLDGDTPLSLTGPGIPPAQSMTIHVSGIPDTFWDLRDSKNRYPRGWDVYLVDGSSIVGLPRTTIITIGG
ncbi:MAG: phosphonate C-P lyase system protein PhnH [Anaerolineaceae bacterium]|nr:phosphonate C-P lyase system protein PhnH [Anaerolineaceae bacterium]